ncbi:MAG: cadherin-like domain-containing protein [Saprospiraceae bacterium]|nr:cadherin-like domain-containing protein [Saprospiraceae bacterium]
MRNYFIIYCLFFLCTTVQAQTVNPAQSDEIINDVGTMGKADPGEQIRYKVTITETGNSTNANGVQLNVTPDMLTTFVPGSFKSSPLAIEDTYACTGNVGIVVLQVSGLLANDFDDNIAGLTASAGTFTTVQGGSITISTNGGFTYTPPAGFTGMDTYMYTLNDGNPVGGPIPAIDMSTVTISVSNLIWFIDNSSVAATSDGRRASPFKSLTDFNANSAAMGDVIYIEHTGINYTNGIVLQTSERLFGEGHTGGVNLSSVLPFGLAPNSIALPSIGGTRPVITNATGIGVALASDNTVRGLDIGNTTGSAFKNSGMTTVGTLTISEVSVSGTGGVMEVLNGGTLAVTFGTLGSTAHNAPFISLNGVGGTMTAGATILSGNTSGDGVNITNTSANFTFASFDLDNIFSDGMELNASTGSFTVSGLTDINTTGGSGVNIQNCRTYTFGNVTVNNRGSAGVYINAITGGQQTGQFGTVTINNQLSSATTGFGIDNTVTTGSTLTVASVAINNNGTSSSCLALSNNDGATIGINGGSIQGSASAAVSISSSAGSATYTGTVNNSAGVSVQVLNNETGSMTTLSGNITDTGSGMTISNNTNSTVTISGASKSLTTTTNTALNIATNTGSTINFTNGGLTISTTSGTGFNVTGGGTVTVQGTGNTIASTTGTALAVSNTTIGASNLNFRSISANGATNGIVLNNTGAVGGLVVTGLSTTDGSGGTIQNISARGVSASNTSNLSLKNRTFVNANTLDAAPCNAADNSGCNAAIYVNTGASILLDNVDINGTAQQGINLRELNGFQLLNSTVINGGAGGQTEEADLYALNLFGTCAITNSSLTVPAERAAVIYNTSKTMALTVTGSTLGMNQTQPLGADALEVNSYGSSSTTLNIVNSTFVQPKTNGLQVITENTSTSIVNITNSMFDPGTGLAAAIDLVANNTAHMDFNILNNPSIKGKGINVVNIFAFPSSTFQGRINGNTVINNGGSGSGIRVVTQGDGNSKVEIKNNNVTGADDYGITANAQSGTGRLDATITGNTVSISSMGFYAIHALAGNSGSMFTNKLCANVANNATTVPMIAIGDFQARASTSTHEVLLQGVGPMVSSNWSANANTPVPGIISQSGAGVFTFGVTCLTPTHSTP